MVTGLMTLFFGVFAFVFVLILVGTTAHMVMFGKVFGLFVRQIESHAKHQQQMTAMDESIECAYCHVTIPPKSDHCPGCGANR